jgi:hypothetical protein
MEASGASREELHQFFAEGMLLNLGAATGLPGEAKDWSLEMFEGVPDFRRNRPSPFSNRNLVDG